MCQQMPLGSKRYPNVPPSLSITITSFPVAKTFSMAAIFRKGVLKVARISRWILMISAFVGLAPASALELGSGDQLLQQEKQRQEALRREREAADPPFTIIPRTRLMPDATADTGPCFNIQTIAVEGVAAFSASRITDIYSPFLNRCLAASDINALIRSLTNLYLDAGYYSR